MNDREFVRAVAEAREEIVDALDIALGLLTMARAVWDGPMPPEWYKAVDDWRIRFRPMVEALRDKDGSPIQ